MYVPRCFSMNPLEDVLLIDSRGLQNGMVVLIEDDNSRVSINDYSGLPKIHPGGDQELPLQIARKYNRWTTVTQLRIDDKTVKFIGNYKSDGGYQCLFHLDLNVSWYVKKDSIPEYFTSNEYGIGFQAGRTAGIAEGLREAEHKYNQGFVDGAKCRHIQLKENETPKTEEFHSYPGQFPPTRNVVDQMFIPGHNKIQSSLERSSSKNMLFDTEVLEQIIEYGKNHPNLKPTAMVFQNPEDGETQHILKIDEAIEEEESGTVIREVSIEEK